VARYSLRGAVLTTRATVPTMSESPKSTSSGASSASKLEQKAGSAGEDSGEDLSPGGLPMAHPLRAMRRRSRSMTVQRYDRLTRRTPT
jgi:hypothetical protein